MADNDRQGKSCEYEVVVEMQLVDGGKPLEMMVPDGDRVLNSACKVRNMMP